MSLIVKRQKYKHQLGYFFHLYLDGLVATLLYENYLPVEILHFRFNTLYQHLFFLVIN